MRGVSRDGQMQEKAENSSTFKLLKIPLPAMLLLFGLYAWAFLVAVEILRSIYRRIRGV